MHQHRLVGCRPDPLASYLKALGVLRLVGEQADPEARGAWQEDVFVLHTKLDEDALRRFFLEAYRPTPMVSPWNGGSGFYPKDASTAIDAIAASTGPRFAAYRRTIVAARLILAGLGAEEKQSGAEKVALMQACRARFPDEALDWMDAAAVLLEDGPKYPPLLGTGGNDGRLEFSNNFMQRLVALIDPATELAGPRSAALLEHALFDEIASDLVGDVAIGQFLPSRAGGANGLAGFDAKSLVNPWDFVLMLEGAVQFAAAAVRRLGTSDRGALAYPFAVRTTSVGYGSASATDSENSRAEMWLPLWTTPTTRQELGAVLGEGRAEVRGRAARDGADFARAVASLGVDRGLDAFQRVGFQVRNGLSYFATPLGRLPVRRVGAVRLVDEIDPWLERVLSRAAAAGAPASVARAARGVEAAIVELCTRGDPIRTMDLFLALGRLERSLVRSLRWADDAKAPIRPLPPLSHGWVEAIDDGSPELRLALALAGVRSPRPLRSFLEPIRLWSGRSRWLAEWAPERDRDACLHDGDLTDALVSTVLRRSLDDEAGPPGSRWSATAPLVDVLAFVERRTNDNRLGDLISACLLLAPGVAASTSKPAGSGGARAPALFGLLSLVQSGRPVRGLEVPSDRHAIRLAAAGDGAHASRHAARRLLGAGLVPAVPTVGLHGPAVRRALAATLFPLSDFDLGRVADQVLRPDLQPVSRGDHSEDRR